MSGDQLITHLMAAAAVITATAQLGGWAARKLRQPAVIGQLLAGLALGPSGLGHLPGHLVPALAPGPVGTALSGMGQFSLVVFLFTTGCELDLSVVHAHSRLVLSVGLAAFALPMATGVGLALLFHPPLVALGAPASLSTGSVVFTGVTMSITAVPVLTAVVRDNRMLHTRAGIVALSAAGVVDALGWSALTLALLSTGHGSSPGPLARLGLFGLLVTVLLVLVRPLLRRLLRGPAGDPDLRLGLLVAFACGTAWATSVLGLHTITGALLAGVCVPRTQDGAAPPLLVERLLGLGGLLLPFFFVLSGRSVDLASIPGDGLLVLLLITALGVTTKIGGSALAARSSGLGLREGVVVGTLLNTRGLTELIVLDVGARAGLITGSLYRVFVLMALITTLLTQPLLDRLRSARTPDRDASGPVKPAPGAAVGSG